MYLLTDVAETKQPDQTQNVNKSKIAQRILRCVKTLSGTSDDHQEAEEISEHSHHQAV